VLEPVRDYGLDYHHDQGYGRREWTVAEQHIRRGLYDCGQYSDILAGVGHLLPAAVCDHLRYDQRREYLLHDGWIVPNNFIHFVLESVHNLGFGYDYD